MPERTTIARNSSQTPEPNTGTARHPQLTPEEWQELVSLGIDPASLTDPEPELTPVSSAFGPGEHQPDIDAKVKAGFYPVNVRR